MKQATVYNCALYLRALVRHIGALTNRNDLIHQIPRVRPGQPRRTIATPEQITALLDAAPRWMKTIILLAAHAGMRKSDCMRVAPIHYNAEKRTITIEQHKTKQTVTVPVTDALAAILEAAPEGPPTTPFFLLYRDKPLTPSGLNLAWLRLKNKAGVERDLWLHDLRRTVAVSLYEISKDLRVVEQMLGHQNLSSTVRYLEHRDPQKLRPYLEALYKPTPKEVD